MIRKYAKVQIAQVSNTLDGLHLRKVGGSFPDFPNLAGRLAAIQPIILNPERFIYVRNRAISALETYGPNGNHDGFPKEELMKSYATFISCPVDVDHTNMGPEDVIGIVLDAVYVPLRRVSMGKKVGDYVENILAIDRQRAEARVPGIIKGILDRQITDTSMGVDVEASECSICGNIARTEFEYCDHIRFQRGEELTVTGAKDAQRVFEINKGLTFFEDAIILPEQWNLVPNSVGADPDAKMAEVLAKQRPKVSVLCEYVVDRTKRKAQMDSVQPIIGEPPESLELREKRWRILEIKEQLSKLPESQKGEAEEEIKELEEEAEHMQQEKGKRPVGGKVVVDPSQDEQQLSLAPSEQEKYAAAAVRYIVQRMQAGASYEEAEKDAYRRFGDKLDKKELLIDKNKLQEVKAMSTTRQKKKAAEKSNIPKAPVNLPKEQVKPDSYVKPKGEEKAVPTQQEVQSKARRKKVQAARRKLKARKALQAAFDARRKAGTTKKLAQDLVEELVDQTVDVFLELQETHPDVPAQELADAIVEVIPDEVEVQVPAEVVELAGEVLELPAGEEGAEEIATPGGGEEGEEEEETTVIEGKKKGKKAAEPFGGGEGLGPGGTCVCPKCDYVEEHATAEPCWKKTCPECGAKMTRKASAKKATISLYQTKVAADEHVEDIKEVVPDAQPQSVEIELHEDDIDQFGMRPEGDFEEKAGQRYWVVEDEPGDAKTWGLKSKIVSKVAVQYTFRDTESGTYYKASGSTPVEAAKELMQKTLMPPDDFPDDYPKVLQDLEADLEGTLKGYSIELVPGKKGQETPEKSDVTGDPVNLTKEQTDGTYDKPAGADKAVPSPADLNVNPKTKFSQFVFCDKDEKKAYRVRGSSPEKALRSVAHHLLKSDPKRLIQVIGVLRSKGMEQALSELGLKLLTEKEAQEKLPKSPDGTFERSPEPAQKTPTSDAEAKDKIDKGTHETLTTDDTSTAEDKDKLVQSQAVQKRLGLANLRLESENIQLGKTITSLKEELANLCKQVKSFKIKALLATQLDKGLIKRNQVEAERVQLGNLYDNEPATFGAMEKLITDKLANLKLPDASSTTFGKRKLAKMQDEYEDRGLHPSGDPLEEVEEVQVGSLEEGTLFEE